MSEGGASGSSAAIPGIVQRCHACCACWNAKVTPEPLSSDPIVPAALPSGRILGGGELGHVPREGDVVVNYPNDSRYQGQFVEGKRHGYGTWLRSDGTEYSGEWRDNVLHGECRERFPDGTRFEGSYVNGMRTGFGVMTWPEGSKYSGQFDRGKATGEGCLLRTDGSVYRGQFSEDCMSGEGCLRWKGGAEYVGQFVANRRDGVGVMKWTTGMWKRYEGDWKDGMHHGQGILINQKDEPFSGRFHFGKLEQWLHPAGQDENMPSLQVPAYWTNQDIATCFNERKDVSDSCKDQIQQLLDGTFRCVRTRDRSGLVPTGLRVLKCHRVENASMWTRYCKAKARVLVRRLDGVCPVNELDGNPEGGFVKTQGLLDEPLGELDPKVNEHFLWHGTTPEGANGVSANGFKIAYAGSRAGTYFGRGCYFAECSSKSDEYAREGEHILAGVYALLLCRVICGSLFRITHPDDKAIELALSSGKYDAVLGDREASVGTYREFVIYDEELAYPEFVVLYERKYTQTPP